MAQHDYTDGLTTVMKLGERVEPSIFAIDPIANIEEINRSKTSTLLWLEPIDTLG